VLSWSILRGLKFEQVGFFSIFLLPSLIVAILTLFLINLGPLQGGADVIELNTGCTVEVTTKDVSNDRALDTPDGPHRLNVD
jgi:hypothetical protein